MIQQKRIVSKLLINDFAKLLTHALFAACVIFTHAANAGKPKVNNN